MNLRMFWAGALKGLGAFGILLGSLDPLEGSVLILPGSGLVALGTYLGCSGRRAVLYWSGVFVLIALGVGALFGLSALGGIGGKGGHSLWWGILILPYPVGWLMAVVAGVAGLVRFYRRRTATR